ncbi:hypothetical protein RFI_00444 [Reticulomyxa filosa]|uniref:AIG1-type G domain-containing protein n=1 Tax=Reticulomyxa filosa TaxID=46433 RepID=X6PEG3_RETFI|nr:hypothetical protein RFI_00444 [Reticulomyxa filosa]|eukprot:ETO36616.1 hypothetical protein RFI_00444 [Reticulomyxa filosa]
MLPFLAIVATSLGNIFGNKGSKERHVHEGIPVEQFNRMQAEHAENTRRIQQQFEEQARQIREFQQRELSKLGEEVKALEDGKNDLKQQLEQQSELFSKQLDAAKTEHQRKLDEALRAERENSIKALEKERVERDKKMQELQTKQETLQKQHVDEMRTMEKSQLLERYDQLKAHYAQMQKPYREYYSIWAELLEEQDELKAKVVEEKSFFLKKKKIPTLHHYVYVASKVLKFGPEISDPATLRIVLYSPTGEGKSLLGNRIAGDNSDEGLKGPFVPSDSVDSKTQEIKKVFIPKGLYKYPVSLTDQPGESDSTGRDREHAANLVAYLKGIEYIHAVVLVKNYQDVRVSDSYQSMLKNLESMLGRKVWKHMIIAKKAPEYGREFSNKIREILKLTNEEAPLPIIYLSNFEEKYLEPLQKLVNEIVPYLGKFHCDSLHSPLDELQVGVTPFFFKKNNELVEKTRETEAARAKYDEITQDLDGLYARIVATEQRLKSLETFLDDICMYDINSNTFVPTFSLKSGNKQNKF